MKKFSSLIRLPERFTFANVNRFISRLSEIDVNQEILLDFGQKRDFPPSAMLLLYPELKKFISTVPTKNLRILNERNHGYAAHLGFFRLIGINYGREINQISTTQNHVSIQQIRTEDWLADLNYLSVSEHVDLKCRELSTVLCSGSDAGFLELVHYNVREIVRNVFEHAEAEEVTLVAQCWPQLRRAQIAIRDDGIGILHTISRSKIVQPTNDKEALRAAIQPGISGSDRFVSGDHWDNSGYGLFMTSEIASKLGKFSITSGNSALIYEGNSITECEFDIKGTFVSMEFQMDNSMKTSDLLEQAANAGERISEERFGNRAGKASRASRGS